MLHLFPDVILERIFETFFTQQHFSLLKPVCRNFLHVMQHAKFNFYCQVTIDTYINHSGLYYQESYDIIQSRIKFLNLMLDHVQCKMVLLKVVLNFERRPNNVLESGDCLSAYYPHVIENFFFMLSGIQNCKVIDYEINANKIQLYSGHIRHMQIYEDSLFYNANIGKFWMRSFTFISGFLSSECLQQMYARLLFGGKMICEETLNFCVNDSSPQAVPLIRHILELQAPYVQDLSLGHQYGDLLFSGQFRHCTYEHLTMLSLQNVTLKSFSLFEVFFLNIGLIAWRLEMFVFQFSFVGMEELSLQDPFLNFYEESQTNVVENKVLVANKFSMDQFFDVFRRFIRSMRFLKHFCITSNLLVKKEWWVFANILKLIQMKQTQNITLSFLEVQLGDECLIDMRGENSVKVYSLSWTMNYYLGRFLLFLVAGILQVHG